MSSRKHRGAGPWPANPKPAHLRSWATPRHRLATPTLHTRFPKMALFRQNSKTRRPYLATPTIHTHLREIGFVPSKSENTPVPAPQPQQSTPASTKLVSFRQNSKTLPPLPRNPNNPHPLARNWFRSVKIRKPRRPQTTGHPAVCQPARPHKPRRKPHPLRDPKPPQTA